ncbi:hypothetical protein [Vibrio quintilis]|nr:hypothetical protein [Vibrio quintilis]
MYSHGGPWEQGLTRLFNESHSLRRKIPDGFFRFFEPWRANKTAPASDHQKDFLDTLSSLKEYLGREHQKPAETGSLNSAPNHPTPAKASTKDAPAINPAGTDTKKSPASGDFSQ